jgi:hypothetical protein
MAFAIPREAPRRSPVPRYLLLHACAGALLGTLAGGTLLLALASGPLAASIGTGTAALCLLGGIITLTPLYLATAIGLLAAESMDDAKASPSWPAPPNAPPARSSPSTSTTPTVTSSK